MTLIRNDKNDAFIKLARTFDLAQWSSLNPKMNAKTIQSRLTRSDAKMTHQSNFFEYVTQPNSFLETKHSITKYLSRS